MAEPQHIDPSKDKAFLAASRNEQYAYLKTLDPEFAKATPRDQALYLDHVLGIPTEAPKQAPPDPNDKSQGAHYRGITGPLYQFHHGLGPQEMAAGNIKHPYLQALGDTGKELAEGFTSPLSIALLAAGPLGKFASMGGRALAGAGEAAEGAQQASNLVRGTQALTDAIKAGKTVQEATQIGKELVQTLPQTTKAAQLLSAGSKAANAVSTGANVANRVAQGTVAAQGLANTLNSAAPIVAGRGKGTDYLNTLSGIAQTGLGGYGATSGLFHGAMQEPYVVGEGNTLFNRGTGEPYTRQEFYDQAKNEGQRMDLSQATQNPYLGSVKDHLTDTLFGRPFFNAMDKANDASFARKYGDFADDAEQASSARAFRQTATPPIADQNFGKQLDVASLLGGHFLTPYAYGVMPAEGAAGFMMTNPSMVQHLTMPPNSPLSTPSLLSTLGQAASQATPSNRNLFGR